MTDNRIEKIRAEIERRYNEYMAKDSELAAIRADECLGILSYIDSMQEEPTIPDIVDEHFWEMLGEEPVSEELEEEMEFFFIKMQVQENENIFENTFKNIARHFAKWQKKKDAETINENALLYNARLEGIEIGKAEMKQQMMKEAKLYGWVARDENGSLHLFEVEPSRIEDRGQWWDRDYNCTTLDKNDFPDLEWEDEPVYVKLIILKEE